MRYIISLLFLFTSLFAETPKAIIFDFGGVVGDLERDVMYTFLSDSLKIPYSKIKHDFKGGSVFKALKKPQQFWKEYAKKPLPDNWFASFDEHSNLMLKRIAGMESCIQAIKAKGFQVALLSNTNYYNSRFISSKGGYDLFNPVVLSCDVGMRKPSSKIYHYTLKLLGKSPNQCIFIDNERENIEAAKQVGIDGILFESVEKLKIELQKRGVEF